MYYNQCNIAHIWADYKSSYSILFWDSFFVVVVVSLSLSHVFCPLSHGIVRQWNKQPAATAIITEKAFVLMMKAIISAVYCYAMLYCAILYCACEYEGEMQFINGANDKCATCSAWWSSSCIVISIINNNVAYPLLLFEWNESTHCTYIYCLYLYAETIPSIVWPWLYRLSSLVRFCCQASPQCVWFNTQHLQRAPGFLLSHESIAV